MPKISFLKTPVTVFIVLACLTVLFRLFVYGDVNEFQVKMVLKTLAKLILAGITIWALIISDNRMRIPLGKNIKSVIPMILIIIFFSVRQVYLKANNLSIPIDFLDHLLFLISCFSVGIFEELFFRVYLFNEISTRFLNSNKPYHIQFIKSILLTSFCFGFIHLTNLSNPDYSIISVINQTYLAFTIGIFFQSVFIRFKNVYLIVVLHGIFNYLGTFKSRLLNLNPYDNYTESISEDLLPTFYLNIGVLVLIILPLSYTLLKKELVKKLPALNYSS